MSTIGIIELVEVCRSMEQRNTRLFEVLGAWVAAESDPSTQRLFAEACHRHAWHAELWRARAPAIPSDAADAPTRPVPTTIDDRSAWYRSELDELRSDLDALRRRTDPELDPSTLRAIMLADTDLADICARLPA